MAILISGRSQRSKPHENNMISTWSPGNPVENLLRSVVFFNTSQHDFNMFSTGLGYVELYESRNGVAKSKMFDQNSSKLDRFSHSIHTNSRTATKQTTIINTVTYKSTKH